MVDTTTGPNESLMRLGSWSPHGRAPRPHDMPADALQRRRGIVRFIVDWGPWIGIIALAVARLSPVDDVLRGLSDTSVLPLIVGVLALLVLLEEYRRFCWTAQRLHDLDRSAWDYTKIRAPFWAMIGIGVILFGMKDMAPEHMSALPVSLEAIWIGAMFFWSFLAFIGLLWMNSRLFRPFNTMLMQTPGDSSANRFGPPPT